VIETQTIRRSRAGGHYAMTNDSTKPSVSQLEAETAIGLIDDWFDPIEAALRDQVRSFIQAMIEGELEAVLARPRYGRRPKTDRDNVAGPERITGHRHGHRSRSLIGTFGRVEIAMPRARLSAAEGRTTEWKSTALRAYQRRTRQADSLIAGAYLAYGIVGLHADYGRQYRSAHPKARQTKK
jgi:putative transposase